MAYIFSRAKCSVRGVKAELMYYADRHVPIRAVAAVMLAVFRTAPTAPSIMIMTETRAHNSAYLRVLSGRLVLYSPIGQP